MNSQMPKASRRVRFEEVTPAHEYATFYNVSISSLVAHLGLPIFDGYDDLDDLQLAFLTLPSGATVTLCEYAGAPGTSLSVDMAMQNIPQIIFDSCQQLRVSRQEIEWVHPDWQIEFDKLYVEHGDTEGIDRNSIAVLAQSEDREPIDCFYHALEIYTRPKFPEHWAMLQHNLGLAYFDRIKGERWDNLQRSIECYHKSLEVFTQDKFSKKWQINQEDLIQSLKVLKYELAGRTVQLAELKWGTISELARLYDPKLIELDHQAETFADLLSIMEFDTLSAGSANSFNQFPETPAELLIDNDPMDSPPSQSFASQSDDSAPSETREISLEEFSAMLHKDPSLVAELAEQFGVETTDPQTIVDIVIAQIQQQVQPHSGDLIDRSRTEFLPPPPSPFPKLEYKPKDPWSADRAKVVGWVEE